MNIRIASEDDSHRYAAYLSRLFAENLATLVPRAGEPTRYLASCIYAYITGGTA